MTSPISTDWRTPFVILLAGTTIVFLSLGARMTFGLWLRRSMQKTRSVSCCERRPGMSVVVPWAK